MLVCPPVFKTACDVAKALGGFDSYTLPPLSPYRSIEVSAIARTTYTYDNSGRLTGSNRAGALSTYVYDANGNLDVKHDAAKSPVTSTYDAANRIVTMQDGPTRVTMTYDDNGNLTSENRGGIVSNYTYDKENRLTEALVGVDWGSSTYNADGLRVLAQDLNNDQNVRYLWDGSDYVGEVTE